MVATILIDVCLLYVFFTARRGTVQSSHALASLRSGNRGGST
jgi:hypothetical protein